MTKLNGEVLTTSPIIQRKKQKARRIKNNFKKVVHNANWSDIDKNSDTDWCKKGKEYIYLTKQE